MDVIYKCRACLSEQDAMLSLFEVYEHGLTLAMILQSCLGKEIEDDDLPPFLCDNCILVLTQFYNFTIVYEQSEKTLRTLVAKNKHTNLKQEIKYTSLPKQYINCLPRQYIKDELDGTKETIITMVDTEEQDNVNEIINEYEIETESDNTREMQDDVDIENAIACDDTIDNTTISYVDLSIKEEADTHNVRRIYTCEKQGIQYDTTEYVSIATDEDGLASEVQLLMETEHGEIENDQILIESQNEDSIASPKYVDSENIHSESVIVEQENNLTEHEALQVQYALEETENSLVETGLSDKQITSNIVKNFHKKMQPVIKGGDGTSHYEEITKYECATCGEAYLYQSSFQTHMRVKHDLNDINSDEYCTKFFVKVKTVTNPPSLTFNNEEQFVKDEPEHECKLCLKRFHYTYLLQQHMQTHDPNKKFVCEICGSSFIRKTYLQDHKEGHSTEKKHVCKFCGKAFKRRTVLRAHKRVHTHPNYYVCEICGRGFTNNSTLKTHKLLIHIRERKFKCVICNQTFPLKATLNKHIRRHQNKHKTEKDFKCTMCNMQYRDKSSLKRHVESKHEGKLKLLSCSYCPKQYTSKTNLFKHNRRYHKDMDPNI